MPLKVTDLPTEAKSPEAESELTLLIRQHVSRSEGDISFVSLYLERGDREHYTYSTGKKLLVEETLEEDLPLLQNGYVKAFYDIAKMLNIGARSDSPGDVWENEMKPKLNKLLGLDDTGEASVDHLKGYYSGRRDAVEAIVSFAKPIIEGAKERLDGFSTETQSPH